MNRMSIPSSSDKQASTSMMCKSNSCKKRELSAGNGLEPLLQTSQLSSKEGYEVEDIFVRKRNRLLQLASETLCIKEHQLSARGYEFVSVFMQRLGMDYKSNTDRIHCNSSKVKIKPGYQLSTFPEADCDIEIHGSSKVAFGKYSPSYVLNSGLPKWYDDPDEFSLSADHRTDPSLSVFCTCGPLIQQKSWEPVTSELGSIDVHLKSDESEVNFPGEFLFNRSGSSSVANLPWYDCSSFGTLPEEEKHVRERVALPLLSWNEVRETEPILSIVPFCNEKNFNSMCTFLEEDSKWSTNHPVDLIVSCSPSSVPISCSPTFGTSREPFVDIHLFATEFEESDEESGCPVKLFDNPPSTLSIPKTSCVSTKGDVLLNGYESDNILHSADEMSFIDKSSQTDLQIWDRTFEYHDFQLRRLSPNGFCYRDCSVTSPPDLWFNEKVALEARQWLKAG